MSHSLLQNIFRKFIGEIIREHVGPYIVRLMTAFSQFLKLYLFNEIIDAKHKQFQKSNFFLVAFVTEHLLLWWNLQTLITHES